MQFILSIAEKTLQIPHVFSHFPQKIPYTWYVFLSFYSFSCTSLLVIEIEDPGKRSDSGTTNLFLTLYSIWSRADRLLLKEEDGRR